jgi:PKD repeat protein
LCLSANLFAQGSLTEGKSRLLSRIKTPPSSLKAHFTYGPSFPAEEQAVQFTDGSKGTPTSWLWDFGDGSTSALRNPSHVYAARGFKRVSLTVANASGSKKASRTITVVAAAMTASFVFSPTTPGPNEIVQFADTTAGEPTSWLWNFGDGATSTVKNPRHAFSREGLYEVTLDSTSSSGAKNAVKTLTVASISTLTSAFSFAPSIPAVKQLVQFTDQSVGATAWRWSFGDGTSSTLRNPTHAYSSAGFYTVSLTASNATRSVTATRTLTVTASPAPDASFDFSPVTAVAGQAVIFSDTSTGSPTSWLWNFGDGTSSAIQNPSHSFATSGSYNVTLTATNVSGSDSVSKLIGVSPSGTLVANFTYAPGLPAPAQAITFTDTSSGTPTSWLWEFGDGATSTSRTPVYAYAAAGSYTVSLSVASSSATNSISKIITVGVADVIQAASPSYADVSAAIANAHLGDTVLVPAGTATWTQGLVITKTIRLIGAGSDKTIIKRSFAGDKLTYLIRYIPDEESRAADGFFRLSGFTFDLTGQLGSCLEISNRSEGFYPVSQNRIDHCRFLNVNQAARALQISGMVWGVFDNNFVTGGTGGASVYGSNETSWTHYTVHPGGADNWYWEDNTITIRGNNLAFGSGAGGRYCARYNTVDVTQYVDYAVNAFDAHGNGYYGGNLSTMILEFYNNTYIANGKGVILGDLRGGQGFIFNNVIMSDQSASGPSIREESMDTVCPPARNVMDGTPQHVHDSYVFNNRRVYAGTTYALSQEWAPNGTVDYSKGQIEPATGNFYPPAAPYRIVPSVDLDFWVEKGTFNGSTGVGIGPLSARPASCSKNGVGYWAMDTNTLYRWTATEGWQEYYKPYAYPHPLRSIQ